MKIVVGKMVGAVGKMKWGQVHDYLPDDEIKAGKRGRLIAVVSLKVEEEVEQVETVKLGREVLARLHELYFGNEELSCMEAIKQAVVGVAEEFGNVDVAGMVLVGDVVYLAVEDGAGVWVKTVNKSGFVVEPGEKEGVAVFSGRAVEGMVIILGNKDFWEKLPKDGLVNVGGMSGTDMNSAVELLAAILRGSESEGEAAVLVRIDEVERLVEVAPSEQEVEEGGVNEEQTKTVVTGENKDEIFKPRKDTVWTKVAQKWAGWGRRIYVRRGDKEEQRKKMMYVGVGLLVMLLIMAGVGQIIMRKRDLVNSGTEAKIVQMVGDFKSASDIVDLNPSRSRELLNQVKVELAEIEKLPNLGDDKRVALVKEQWETVFKKAAGVVDANSSEVVDLSLVRSDMVGTKLAWQDTKLDVLDADGGRVVEINPKDGSAKVIGGGNVLSGARLIAGYPGKTMVLADKGIVEVGVVEPRIVADSGWGEIVSMQMFAGNIYLLDRGNGEIWAYSVKGDGFANKRDWLASGEDKDKLKLGESMAIDGSVWVITDSGFIKYTRGNSEQIAVDGLDKPWGSGAVIYTDENSDKLYVLDVKNSRVLVFAKDGSYVKQFVGTDWNQATDLVVDEKGGKMFLVIKNKVISVSL